MERGGGKFKVFGKRLKLPAYAVITCLRRKNNSYLDSRKRVHVIHVIAWQIAIRANAQFTGVSTKKLERIGHLVWVQDLGELP
jgi:hypothetical protein